MRLIGLVLSAPLFILGYGTLGWYWAIRGEWDARQAGRG